MGNMNETREEVIQRIAKLLEAGSAVETWNADLTPSGVGATWIGKRDLTGTREAMGINLENRWNR